MSLTKLFVICCTVLLYGYEKFSIEEETELIRLRVILELKEATAPRSEKPSVEIIPQKL